MDKKVINQINDLKNKIYLIQCKNWIESVGNGTSAAGKTLEFLIGKSEDNNVLPDFGCIEIKTRSEYSKSDLHLFSCAFDNRPLEMQRLLNIGGYPDKKRPEFKVFQVSINAVDKKQIRSRSYRIAVNKDMKKLELRIYYLNSNRIYTTMSWSFEELKRRLENKLSYLCVIPVKKYPKNGKIYFKYMEPKFYKLKDFDAFLALVTAGKIKVTFKLSYYHEGEKFGQLYDKGTSFDLDFNCINELFDEISV